MKAISINTDNISDELIINIDTEFIEIIGVKELPISIILPDEIENGHLIEIISNTDLLIENNIYKDKCLRIRYVVDKWIIY